MSNLLIALAVTVGVLLGAAILGELVAYVFTPVRDEHDY